MESVTNNNNGSNADGGWQQLAATLGVRILPVTSFVTQEPRPHDYLFGQFALTAGTYAVIFAPGDSGKTNLALAAAMTLALAGAPGCHHDPLHLNPSARAEGNKVVYLTGEDPDDEVHRRLYALATGIGPDGYAALDRNLLVLSTLGAAKRPLITDPALQTMLIAAARGARLIVIDTLARFHAADESKAEQMADVVAAIEYVAIETGATVIVLHHCAKGAVVNGLGTTTQAARGSTVITDHARWALAMCGDGEGGVEVVEAKHNYGRGGKPFRLRWTEDGTLERAADAEQIVNEIATRFKQTRVAKHHGGSGRSRRVVAAPGGSEG